MTKLKSRYNISPLLSSRLYYVVCILYRCRENIEMLPRFELGSHNLNHSKFEADDFFVIKFQVNTKNQIKLTFCPTEVGGKCEYE